LKLGSALVPDIPELNLLPLLQRLTEGEVDYVVGLEDLLSMKRAAHRPQDLADVEALETARHLRRRTR
jgi:hypothetical protein